MISESPFVFCVMICSCFLRFWLKPGFWPIPPIFRSNASMIISRILVGHLNLGLIPSTKIWVLRNFLTKIWQFWIHQFFQKFWEISRQNILVPHGWTDFRKFSSEYFDRKTIWTSEEIFRILIILSEFWEYLCWWD